MEALDPERIQYTIHLAHRYRVDIAAQISATYRLRRTEKKPFIVHYSTAITTALFAGALSEKIWELERIRWHKNGITFQKDDMSIVPLILLFTGLFFFIWLLLATKAKSKKDKEPYP